MLGHGMWSTAGSRRTSRDGVVGAARGVAEDYGDFADGLLVPHQATGDGRWLGAPSELLDVALEHFADGDGGFFDTPDEAAATGAAAHRDPRDNAAPSGVGRRRARCSGYAALTGSAEYRAAAEQALGVVGELGVEQPRFLGLGRWQRPRPWWPARSRWPWSATTANSRVPRACGAARRGGRSGAPDSPGAPLLASRPLSFGTRPPRSRR